MIFHKDRYCLTISTCWQHLVTKANFYVWRESERERESESERERERERAYVYIYIYTCTKENGTHIFTSKYCMNTQHTDPLSLHHALRMNCNHSWPKHRCWSSMHCRWRSPQPSRPANLERGRGATRGGPRA